MLGVGYMAVFTITEKMEGGKLYLGIGLLVWTWCFQWSDAKDLWDGSSHLHCGIESMKLSFPLSIEGIAFSLTVLGK